MYRGAKGLRPSYRRGLCSLIMALTLASPLFPQEQASPEGLFAPYITGLEAEAKNNRIRLSWTDSPDVLGPVYVYRSLTPIDETRLGGTQGQPVEVPYGVQSYIDEGESHTTYYYYIRASNINGQEYQVMLPGVNTVNISLGELEDFSPSGPFAEWSPSRRPIVSSLEARNQEDSVVITYRLENAARSAVILYRNVQPITQYRDLLSSVIVQSGISSPFVDYPVPGIPYYYAVVFEDDLKAGRVEIRGGTNATVLPVEVPAGKYRVGLPRPAAIRSMPLPLISVYTAVPWMDGLSELPPETPLSPAAAKVVADMRENAPYKRREAMSPQTFPQDMPDAQSAPDRGEEYVLRSIVQGPFSQGNWSKSREELLHFLALPRSAGIEARARFYLGQAYYFSAFKREALFEFLSIQSSYPRESAKWVEAALSLLVDENS